MREVNYMNSLESASLIGYQPSVMKDLDRRQYILNKTWNEFESFAQLDGYDILEPNNGDEKTCEEIRQQMTELLRVLYSIPGSDRKHDVEQIIVKDRDYGGSWCKRGGANAFFMLVRKWDRIENTIKTLGSLTTALSTDTRVEGIQDDLGDLRRYLILCIAWHLEAYSCE